MYWCVPWGVLAPRPQRPTGQRGVAGQQVPRRRIGSGRYDADIEVDALRQRQHAQQRLHKVRTRGRQPCKGASCICRAGWAFRVGICQICQQPSLTIASCQQHTVANSRCCWVLTAPGLLMPLPRRRTPDIPARGPLAEGRRREPIRCQCGSGIKSSYPRASRPYGVNHQ